MITDISLPARPPAAHIAIVMHDFSTGGSERIAIRLANQWARSGRRVTILSGVADGPARAGLDPIVEVIGMWPPIIRSRWSRLALGSVLADCIALLEPDVVFAPGNFHIPVIGTVARIMGSARPATVCKLSNPLLRRDRPAALQVLFAWLTRRFARSIDAFVAMSTSLAAEAQPILRSAQVRRIYEPNVDAAPGPPPARAGTPRAKVILCAGRLVAQKNFALAIRAIAQLDGHIDARLVILGDGEERAMLEALIVRLGLADRVTLAGYVPDIRPALAQADLFLLSSGFEGYPAVLIEAICAGLPVITTACSPAISEIMIDRDYGRIVASDPVAMAEAIAALLGDGSGNRGNAEPLIERHRLDRVANEYLELFDEIVQTRRNARQAASLP